LGGGKKKPSNSLQRGPAFLFQSMKEKRKEEKKISSWEKGGEEEKKVHGEDLRKPFFHMGEGGGSRRPSEKKGKKRNCSFRRCNHDLEGGRTGGRKESPASQEKREGDILALNSPRRSIIITMFKEGRGRKKRKVRRASHLLAGTSRQGVNLGGEGGGTSI